MRGCQFPLVFLVTSLVAGRALSLEAPPGPVASLVADLQKGDREKLLALHSLEALGPKAAGAVSALVELLAVKNEEVRLQSAIVLGKIGGPAVGPLTGALGSSDSGVRFYAVWALAFVGPEAKSATAAVVKVLGDPSADVRRKAAYALGRIASNPEAVVSGLVGALSDENEDVRQAAAEALPHMGKAALPALRSALGGTKAVPRNLAIKAVAVLGAAAESAIPELKRLLLDPDKGSAQAAAEALAGIGTPSLPALLEAVSDNNLAVRALAMQALQKLGTPAVPALVDLLGAKQVDVRRQSAALLGGIPVNDKMVIIGLGYATKDTDFQVRRNALQALRGRGPGAMLAEPYISALLTDIDPQMRQEAFHTLQNLGVDARPGLKKALGSPDPTIRITTASLMAALNFEVSLAEPVLLDALKEKDGALKMQAATALAQRGLQADVVLPMFVTGLKNDLASVRRQATEAIARYGAKGKPAVPALIAALEDTDDSVRSQALQALRQVGAEPRELLPAMVKVLRRKDDPLHGAAAQTLFQVGPGAVAEISALAAVEDAPALRLACLQTLAMIGPPAKEAVGPLTKALGDPAPRIRMIAARALGNIGPDAKPALDALAGAEKDGDANLREIAKAASAQIRADPAQKQFQVQGVFTTSDPPNPVRKGSFHVVHVMALKAGQAYTIDLNSPWDNYLRLENSQGQRLAEDDDSGGNLNARISFRPPQDGWYRIIVTTFAAGASGPYRLTVR